MKTSRTTVDKQQPQDMLAWVDACRHLPVVPKGLEVQRSRSIFATDGTISYQWKNREGEKDQRIVCMPLEEVLATTMHTQASTRHILTPCVARASGQSSGDRFASKARDRGKTEPDAGGASKLSALSQRLLKRWTDRRECVSEPPRNEL